MLKSLQVPSHHLKPGVPPGALAEILRSVKGQPVFPIVNIQLLRSMSKACYDTNPVGHYGLALKDYAHFTSPIRRYPDLAVHRILSQALAGGRAGTVSGTSTTPLPSRRPPTPPRRKSPPCGWNGTATISTKPSI